MASLLASAAIGKIVDKLKSYLEAQWEYQLGEKPKLQRLERHLTMIRAVIHEAEKGQIENLGLSTWLQDIQDAVYAAEDVLDNIEYQILRDKATELSKVRTAVKSATIILKRSVFADVNQNQLDTVIEKFGSIASKMGKFLQLKKSDMRRRWHDLDSRVTTSTLVEPEPVGRDDKIAYLVKLLTKREDNSMPSNNKFDVISIYGIGGVGKTVLAQAVYNNSEVKNFFNLRVWLCVSNDFDVMRLTKEIIESVCIKTHPNVHNFTNLNTVQGFLSDGLMEKKFLIVLDDVWDEVDTKWKILQTPFMCAKEGSQVIITTRNKGIARMMNAKTEIALEGLEDNYYRSFFTQCAFGNKSPQNYPQLEDIASKIAKKLGGLPLAAKTVGGILRHKLNEEFWREILQSNLWQLEQGKDGILPVLRLSYEHLPTCLKQCFVYCSLFPKNFPFNMDELVRLWMAQGFILPSSGMKRMEDIGREYFELLLDRSFFQRSTRFANTYVIHDLMHDLAQSVSFGEYYIIKDDKPFQAPKNVRHLFFEANNASELLKNVSDFKTLRSLIIYSGELGSQDLQNVIKSLKYLRVLVIDSQWIQLPEVLGNLRCLRYLSIQGGCDKKDEKSLSELCHLQTLSIGLCKSLPKEINQLINLRYLKTPDDVDYDIPNVGGLTSLQELKEFHVKKESGYKLSQLSGMRQLRGRLHITGIENIDKDDICNSVLINMEHLNELELEWSSSKTGHEPEEVLECLEPHCNLKDLMIKRFPGNKSPKWLERDRLFDLHIKTICLYYCRSWEVPPCLGQLRFLKVLELKGLAAVKEIGHEFYGSGDAYPHLEKLVFWDMKNFKEWSGPKIPRLRELHVTYCPNLMCPLPVTSLPKKLVVAAKTPTTSQDIPAADSFVLVVDEILSLPRRLPAESLSTLRELKIREFIGQESFNSEQENWFCKLTSLTQLTLSSCEKLSSLPAHLNSVPSLERLMIDNCCEIHSIPENGLPKSLTHLDIEHCHPTLEERCQRGSDLDWPKIAHIKHICINGVLLSQP